MQGKHLWWAGLVILAVVVLLFGPSLVRREDSFDNQFIPQPTSLSLHVRDIFSGQNLRHARVDIRYDGRLCSIASDSVVTLCQTPRPVLVELLISDSGYISRRIVDVVVEGEEELLCSLVPRSRYHLCATYPLRIVSDMRYRSFSVNRAFSANDRTRLEQAIMVLEAGLWSSNSADRFALEWLTIPKQEIVILPERAGQRACSPRADTVVIHEGFVTKEDACNALLSALLPSEISRQNRMDAFIILSDRAPGTVFEESVEVGPFTGKSITRRVGYERVRDYGIVEPSKQRWTSTMERIMNH